MIPALQPYLLWIKIGLVAALCAASFYAGHALRDRSAKQDQLDAALDYAAEINTARRQEQAWADRYAKGLQDARAREKQLADDAAAAGRAAVSLRHTVASLKAALPAATAETCRHTAATALAVFGECADQYRAVAAAADSHASDAAAFSDTWPE